MFTHLRKGYNWVKNRLMSRWECCRMLASFHRFATTSVLILQVPSKQTVQEFKIRWHYRQVVETLPNHFLFVQKMHSYCILEIKWNQARGCIALHNTYTTKAVAKKSKNMSAIHAALGSIFYMFCESTLLGVPSLARLWREEFGEFPRPAWAVGSYSIGPPAGGTPQILLFKT